MRNSLKEILVTKCLPALFSRWEYISLDQIKEWLNEHQAIYKSSTITKCLSKMKQEEENIWDAGRGWYSNNPIPFEIDRKPVQKIVELLRTEYSNLEFSCWSTEQINRYLSHLLSSFVTFIHIDQGYEEEIIQFLDAKGQRVFRRHTGSQLERLSSQAQTLYVQTFVKRAPSTDGYASIEKILVDLCKENILPTSELKHAIGSIIDNYRINIGTLLSYAKRNHLKPADVLLGSKSINSTFPANVELVDSRNQNNSVTIHKQNNAQLKNLLKRPHLHSTLKEMGNVTKQTLEKSIRALALVTRLAESGLPFLFKGGTSLLLLLKRINRLSIDVDITCDLSPSELRPYFNRVLETGEFSKYEPGDGIEEENLPLSSFVFIYQSIWDGKTDSIRLDVLREQQLFQHAKEILVTTPFFRPINPTSVIVPTITELLADKLTAFAPHTLGPRIDVDTPEVMHIAKHLFDVGELFNESGSVSILLKTHMVLVEKENKYLQTKYTSDRILEDVFESARIVSMINTPGVNQTKEMDLYKEGFQAIRSHVIPDFLQSDYKLAASKAALCAAILLHNKQTKSLSAYKHTKMNIEKAEKNMLQNNLEPLNALFKTAILAYIYWVEIQKIIQQK